MQINYDFGQPRHSATNTRGNNSDRQDSYDRGNAQGHQYQQAVHQTAPRRHMGADDRSHSGNRVQTNNYMPPRYPQADRGNYGYKQGDMGYQHGGFSQTGNMFSPSNAFPRGGTGATDDSFNSSFKPPTIQQASFTPGYQASNANANYSSIALTTNSFQIGGGMGPDNSNSFDAAAANLNSRTGPPSSYSNTQTDWKIGGQGTRSAMMDLSANDHISETRSNNNKYGDYNSVNLDGKYMRDDSGYTSQYQRNQGSNQASMEPQVPYFRNQRLDPASQHDRLDDDDQRSPERRTHKRAMAEQNYTPDRQDRMTYSRENDRMAFGRPQSSQMPAQTIPANRNNLDYDLGKQRTVDLRSSGNFLQPQTQMSAGYAVGQKRDSSQTSFDQFLQNQTGGMRRTHPHLNHQQQQQQTMHRQGQTSPQKGRKRKRTVLDQKEHFKIRPTNDFQGTGGPLLIQQNPKAVSWSEAIGCIADFGIDMTSFAERQQIDRSPNRYGDFDDAQRGDVRQASRSDGFNGWQRKPKQAADQPAMQTDFYNKHDLRLDQRAVSNVEDASYSQLQVNQQQFSDSKPPKKSQTQNNFFKMPNRFAAENISTDSLHEPLRNDLVDSLAYTKSPSGNQKIGNFVERSPSFNTAVEAEITKEQEKEAIQTLMKLRFSDLIYLLNILKLQRSKSSKDAPTNAGSNKQDQTAEDARQLWINDLQLALSVAVTAEDRESKDTSKIAKILIDKVDACRSDKLAVSTSADYSQSQADLQYEHFIGPLVVICATNSLLRADGSDQSEAECSSTIKLCFDQFERYYAKAVQGGNQRRSNSMTGPVTNSVNGAISRSDSSEVQPEKLKNFVISLKGFIERESLPCKSGLSKALKDITLEKVQSNQLIFPQGSQLILSQMNRLFGVHIGKQAFDPLDHNAPGFVASSSPRHNNNPSSYLGSRHGSIAYAENVDGTPIKGQTQAPRYIAGSQSKGHARLHSNGSNENLRTQQQQQPSQKATPTKPQFTLQPSFGNKNNQTNVRDHYYQKQSSMKEPPSNQERRQHSMIDFSASRRMNTQDLNYVSNQDGNHSNMAAEYRPFSTIISGKDEGEVQRQNLYGAKNQPMSLELEHKRSVQVNSKSVQKPKKGILKQSSSYLEGSSLKKQPVHFKQNATKSALIATQPNQSPYLAMANRKKVIKTAQQLADRVQGGLTTTKKSNNMRQDSQKNLIQRLGNGDEPPKFSHAANAGKIITPKMNSHTATDFDDPRNSGSYSKKKPATKTSSNTQGRASGQGTPGLAHILRSGGGSNPGSTTHHQQQLRQTDSRQSPGRSKYSALYNNQANNADGLSFFNSSTPTTQTGQPSLSATSMKYLKAAQAGAGGNYAHYKGSSANMTAHSNVLIKAQNMQNRNDSFGNTANTRQQEPKQYGSSLIQQLMSPQPTSMAPSSHAHKVMSTIENPNQHRLLSPDGNRPQHQLQHSPIRSSHSYTGISSSAKRSASYQGGSSGMMHRMDRMDNSAGFNYPHPRLSSASQRDNHGQVHNSGGRLGSSGNGLRSSDFVAKQGGGVMATHTDFNHVSQFSLTSSKNSANDLRRPQQQQQTHQQQHKQPFY